MRSFTKSQIRSVKGRFSAGRAVMSVFGLGLIVIIIFPVIYMIFSSFMSQEEISSYYTGIAGAGSGRAMLHLIPDKVTLGNYYSALLGTGDYWAMFWKSLLLSTVIVLIQVVISSLAGFAFAKYTFPGRRALYFGMLVLMLLPVQVTVVPNYILFSRLGLLNTWWPLILSSAFSPFGTFMMTQIFRAVPNEIIEAARLDGAGTLRLIWDIVLPVGKSGLISVVILVFIDAWNMVEQPLAFIPDPSNYPLSVFLAFLNEGNLGVSFVCGLLAMIPGLILFLYFRDELAEGIEFVGNI